MSQIVVASLYKFADLHNYCEMRQPLQERCTQLALCGTILLAAEGINGTLAGSRESINAILRYLKRDKRLAELAHQESIADKTPFYRMKVKLKKEIVTMGKPEADPNKICGERVGPQKWNELMSDPDVLVLDTRNEYECSIGTFKNASLPNTNTFREFPEYVNDKLDPAKHKKVAMFCTGGIRCEKASSYMLQQGFEEVFHLDGGILKYLENVNQDENLWQGECFVFDARVSVNEKLAPGDYLQCYACRAAVSPQQSQSEKYAPGISCPTCYDDLDDEKRGRMQERQKQIELAKQRGEVHIGKKQS